MNKTITRSTVNTENFSASEFSKSGFNLGYRDYNDYMLGRWSVSGFQWTMPSDKISGVNKGNFTLKRMVTPMVAPIHVGQYNVYVTLRSIDNTYQRNFAPSKHNGMSADWSLPMINTKQLVENLISSIFGKDSTSSVPNPAKNMLLLLFQGFDPNEVLASFLTDNNITLTQFLYSTNGLVNRIIYALTNSGTLAYDNPTPYDMAKDFYCVDALKDIVEFVKSRFGDGNNPISTSVKMQEFMYNFLDVLLTPWVGRYSYYADFGYNFVRPEDIYRLSQKDAVAFSSLSTFFDCFDSTPLCEYPLRAMYLFWYDRCRDVNLQPVSSTLPDPRDFGSTPVVTGNRGLMYLLYRIRRWTENMFISAMPDSPVNYVYAPIVNAGLSASNGPQFVTGDMNHKDVDQHSATGNYLSEPASYTLRYLDPLTGSVSSVTCPVPTYVNDALSRVGMNKMSVLALQLQNLRQAQNLERYLKRLDFFGDEYNDYMLGQYNSRVSDLRINHAEILSQSLDDANYEQEIANMSNGISDAGDRTATGTLSSGGDGYETFCEEFGLVINVITFMPEDSYDGVTPQLLMNKLVDFPLPIFAANNDELGRIMEIAANGLSPAINGDDSDFRFMFGHYPAYHAWRSRVDRVRGTFLNEMQDCLFRRFYGMTDKSTTPRLNYEFINCRPNLQMFANTVLYDCQVYGDVVHECYVERVLPTPVEQI